MDRNDISLAVVKRLPRYYRYLEELLDNGVERISSGDQQQNEGIGFTDKTGSEPFRRIRPAGIRI